MNFELSTLRPSAIAPIDLDPLAAIRMFEPTPSRYALAGTNAGAGLPNLDPIDPFSVAPKSVDEEDDLVDEDEDEDEDEDDEVEDDDDLEDDDELEDIDDDELEDDDEEEEDEDDLDYEDDDEEDEDEDEEE